LHIEKLSLYIITLNEERRLPMVLDSVAGLVDEIVIVDSGSTDDTEDIARRYGARFIHHEWESVGHQVKWAEEQCANRWVLRLDADEVVSSELAREISDIRQNGRYDAYYLRLGDVIVGRAKPNPWVWHYKKIRLYDRDAFTMDGALGHDDVVKVNENATAAVARNFIHHSSYLTMHQVLEKHTIESDRLVARAVVQKKNYSPWRMVGMFSINFFKRFFIHRFFLYGFWGFIYSVEYAFFRFLKFSKFYEQEQLKKYKYPASVKDKRTDER
jgi:glycosyltransferase involved in cell wall biosynthesis